MKNKIKSLRHLAPVCAALFLCAACGTTPEKSGPDPRLVLESSIADTLAIEPLRVRQTKDGLTEIAVVLKNPESKQRAYDLRVEWHDADGFPINTVQGNWTRTSIYPQSSETAVFVAPSPKSTQFKIHIRASTR